MARRICYSKAPGEEGAPLLAEGITHVLNVGEAASPRAEGLVVVERCFTDLVRIPEEIALACLNDVHAWLADPANRILVHCVEGVHRSPTIVWLYLVALGMDPRAARLRGEAVNPRAMPGHPLLVDATLQDLVVRYGEARLRSSRAADALELPDPISL